MIDLRSDTQTQPTEGMRQAIANAVVGDEQRREDPTVNELERRSAELLGHEEAVFLPTASMGNQIALRLLGEPGDELLAEENSHVLIAELGGPAVHSGLVTRGLPGEAGRLTVDQIASSIRPQGGVSHFPRTRIVSIENTHNSSGGRVWPLEEIAALGSFCRERDLRLHLDGARIMNAAIALGVPASELAGRADTVTICLSKGLGCPLGALVAGSSTLMAKARSFKHLFGGAMRQAGIVAAAGLYALDHHVERLADDHARARRLAEGLQQAGLPVDPGEVETNFVRLDVASLGIERAEAIERLKTVGVGVSTMAFPTVIRAVTHLGIGDEDIDRAVELIPRALGTLAPA